MKTKFSKGDRVYFVDEGPEDKGIIEAVKVEEDPRGREVIVYDVLWADGEQVDGGFYTSQLAAL